MPRFAPLVVLSFLGSLFLLAVCTLALIYGAARRSRFLAKTGAAAGTVVKSSLRSASDKAPPASAVG